MRLRFARRSRPARRRALRRRYGHAEGLTRWKLERIYDVRPIDFHTGKRVPVSDVDELPICDRCTRRHAKVYVVRDTESGQTAHVGSGCCKQAFGGWEPTKEEVKSARAQERDRAAERRQAKVDAIAAPIVDAMLAVPIPEPKLLDVKPVWADRPGGEKVEVWGTEEHHVMCYHGFDAERRSAYENLVRDDVMSRMLKDVPKLLWSEVYHTVVKQFSERRRR